MTRFNESRPAGDGAADKQPGDGGSFLDCIPLRLRAFVADRVNAARGPIPRFGSDAWHALADGDLRRDAAMAVAALAWFSEGVPEIIAVDFANKLHGERQAAKRREDEDYRAAVAEHRREHAGKANIVSFAERRRRQLEAVGPRPGDFPGRGGRR